MQLYHVALQVLLLHELLHAGGALIGHLPRVRHHVEPQLHPPLKHLLANRAREDLLSSVHAIPGLVLQEILFSEITFPTFGALEWLLTSVFPVVHLQVVLAEEALMAGRTLHGRCVSFPARSPLQVFPFIPQFLLLISGLVIAAPGPASRRVAARGRGNVRCRRAVRSGPLRVRSRCSQLLSRLIGARRGAGGAAGPASCGAERATQRHGVRYAQQLRGRQ